MSTRLGLSRGNVFYEVHRRWWRRSVYDLHVGIRTGSEYPQRRVEGRIGIVRQLDSHDEAVQVAQAIEDRLEPNASRADVEAVIRRALEDLQRQREVKGPYR